MPTFETTSGPAAQFALILLIGLQGSGKTTFYHRYFAHSHVLVSKDLFPNNRNKPRRQQQLLAQALRAGQSVVLDNTNPTREDRAAAIALAHEFGASVTGYVFPPNVRTALEQNQRREGKARVPDVAIYATVSRFQQPHLGEGFDQLFTICPLPDGDFEITPWT